MNKLLQTFRILHKAYGPQGWWPVTPEGENKPHYGVKITLQRHRFEIAIGAILTQNTAWTNAEKALIALHAKNVLTPEKILKLQKEKLALLIRPAGYFNQKAERLMTLAEFFTTTDITQEETTMLRTKLLALQGVGPETADSILLYAAEKPVFVIDAYTRRIFSRMGYLPENGSYETWQNLFHSMLPKDTILFKEYHALLVKHTKKACRKRPVCETCIFSDTCKKLV